MELFSTRVRNSSSLSASEDTPTDGRVSAALEEYLGLAPLGRKGRDKFLARHAEIAEVLADCLDALDLIQSGARGLASLDDGGAPARVPPTRLGDYRILREVGRGGMGIVYEAEQISLGRRVALKVLAASGSLDPRQRQRFRVEAHATALLQHENIVPVFGVGNDEGVDYYAMRFVEGRSLAEVIRDARPSGDAGDRGAPTAAHCGSAAPPTAPIDRDAINAFGAAARRGRDWRAVAALGLQAASALEHSHGVGVYHRDIKPSNLLVEPSGHLWVTDFGLARIACHDQGLTRTGDVVGTLRYMSPEQIRKGSGAADPPRSDIYALGLTLYELATLRPAFEGTDPQDLVRRIVSEEPPAPRRLNPSIPRDLETIVLKAMTKETTGRYASASELAVDLRLFLADRPIRARRPGPVERIARWARRHRAAVTTAAAFLLVALSIASISMWAAKRKSDAALLSESRAAWRGRMAFEVSRTALDRVAGIFAEKFASGDRSLTNSELQQTCRDAIEFYERAAEVYSDRGSSTEVAARAWRSSASLRILLHDSRAEDDYRRSIHAYESLAVRNPGFLWLRTGLIETQTEFARHLRTAGRTSEGDAAIRRALEVAEGLLSDPRADVPCFSQSLGWAFHELARLVIEDASPRPNDASPRPNDPSRAAALARKAVSWSPDESSFWNTLGLALYRVGDLTGSSSAIQKAMELRDGGGPGDWLALALVRHRQGDLDGAQHLLERSRAKLSPDQLRLRDSSLRRLYNEVSDALVASPAAPTGQTYRASRATVTGAR